MTPATILDGIIGFFLLGFFWPFTDQSFWDTPMLTLLATGFVFACLMYVGNQTVCFLLNPIFKLINIFIRDELKKLSDYDVRGFAVIPTLLIVWMFWAVVGEMYWNVA